MASSDDSKICLFVKSAKEKRSVTLDLDSNVSQLRKSVSEEFGVDTARITLIFAGKILKDEDKLCQHSIKDGLTVHLVIKPNQPANQQSVGQSPNTATSHSAPSESTTSPNPAAGSSPGLQNLSGLGGLLGNGSLGNMQASMQQQMMENPDMIRQMLDNPMVQNLMSNPEIMRSLISANPQMRDIMERNPEISQMLNNPEMLRQSLELARNPAMMQEMMRNYDRSLSNLESMPGGMNHLQRIYRDIQEPMFEAAASFGGARNPFAELAGGQTSTGPQGVENTDPLPNPWGGGSSHVEQQTSANQSSGENNSRNAPTTNPTQSGVNQSAMLQQLTSNPEVMRSLTDTMMQNPQVVEHFLGNSGITDTTQRQQILNMAPHILSQMNQPAFRSMVNNPRAMQAMMQIQQGVRTLQEEVPEFFSTMGGLGNFMPPSTTGLPNSAQPSNTNTTTGTPGTGVPGHNTGELGNMVSGIMGMMGNNPNMQQQNNQPPEERYASQLEQLSGMGFINREENIRALVATFGDVNAAIDQLLQAQFR